MKTRAIKRWLAALLGAVLAVSAGIGAALWWNKGNKQKESEATQ